MISTECAQCGKTFGAQRSTAQYCSSKCRVAATRQRQRTAPAAVPQLPVRREGAALLAMPPVANDEHSLTSVTLGDLETAGRLRTPAGILAVKLAQILDSGVQDTGSSIAALGRQYMATMDQALAGVKVADTPLEALRKARQSSVA